MCSVKSESSSLSSAHAGCVQQQLGLVLVKPEIRDTDLVHQSACPPAGERERGLLAARNRDLRAGREVPEQCRERVEARRVADGMQIVEHQHERPLERRQGTPHARDAFDQVDPPGPESALKTSAGSGSTPWSAAAM